MPMIGTVAAAVAREPANKVLSDSNLLSKALRETCQLLGGDAITVVFDETLIPEALGGPPTGGDTGKDAAVGKLPEKLVYESDPDTILSAPRVQVVLQAVSHLRQTSAGRTKILGALPGPALLLGMVDLEELEAEDVFFCMGDVLLALVRAMGEAGAEGVVLYERTPPEEDSRGGVSRLLSSIKRVGGHFSLEVVLLIGEGSALAVSETVLGCEPHALITPRKTCMELLETGALRGRVRMGIGIGGDLLLEGEEEDLALIREFIDREEAFISNSWAIPPETDLRRLREFGESIAGLLAG